MSCFNIPNPDGVNASGHYKLAVRVVFQAKYSALLFVQEFLELNSVLGDVVNVYVALIRADGNVGFVYVEARTHLSSDSPFVFDAESVEVVFH